MICKKRKEFLSALHYHRRQHYYSVDSINLFIILCSFLGKQVQVFAILKEENFFFFILVFRSPIKSDSKLTVILWYDLAVKVVHSFYLVKLCFRNSRISNLAWLNFHFQIFFVLYFFYTIHHFCIEFLPEKLVSDELCLQDQNSSLDLNVFKLLLLHYRKEEVKQRDRKKERETLHTNRFSSKWPVLKIQ